jgi:hypothetical protein
MTVSFFRDHRDRGPAMGIQFKRKELRTAAKRRRKKKKHEQRSLKKYKRK